MNRSVLCRWTLLCNLHTVSVPALSWGIKDLLMRCNCQISINSITSELNPFVFYLSTSPITRSRTVLHCSFLLSVMSEFIYYMWKVFLVCWDLIPETVRASMPTGSEQILATRVLLRSFKSSESPSPVTSASSNQAVSQAAGDGCQPSIVPNFRLNDKQKRCRTYFVLPLLKNECLKEEDNYHYDLGRLFLILFEEITDTFCG